MKPPLPLLPLLLLCGLCAALLALSPAASRAAPETLAEAARRAGIQVGAAVEPELNAPRRETLAREFTSATAENVLKWGPISPAPRVYDFSRADALVDLAEQSGLRIRGHTLVWHRLNGPPSWLADFLAAAPDPAAALTALLEDHVATVVGRYAGRIDHWDVVNEPLSLSGAGYDASDLVYQTLGEGYIDRVFAAARAADPDAVLYLNETLTEFPAKFEALFQLVERLLARGVPIDGVGLQGHYVLSSPDAAALREQFARIGSLGLEVEVTELDLHIGLFAGPDPLAGQAEAYAGIFAACLAVPACTGITTWGIDDADSWLDESLPALAPGRPLLFDELLQPKPAYHAVLATLQQAVTQVAIDVRPGSDRNGVQPGSRGVVPVAVLGSDAFDVGDVDPATLAFGPAGAPLVRAPGPYTRDVDGDGHTDLLAHFRIEDTGIAWGDTEASLTGRTVAGVAFTGSDAITTLPACGIGFELPFVLAPLLGLRRRRRDRAPCAATSDAPHARR